MKDYNRLSKKSEGEDLTPAQKEKPSRLQQQKLKARNKSKLNDNMRRGAITR